MDVILLIAAVAPALILIALLYRADTADKEPTTLVATCFALGAIATIPVSIFELVANSIFTSIGASDSTLFTLLQMTLGVALIEELFKMAAALIPTWRNDAFNYVFDGVVYCAAAALGFACLENVLYVFDGGLETALVRAAMSVPSHMVDGIFMGLFVGYAKYFKYRGEKGKVVACFILALLIPIIEHGIFDSLASSDSSESRTGILVLLATEYIVALIIIIKKRGKNDVLIFESPGPATQPDAAEAPAQYAAAQLPQNAQGMTGFCKKCGCKLPPSANYCGSCGARIGD